MGRAVSSCPAGKAVTGPREMREWKNAFHAVFLQQFYLFLTLIYTGSKNIMQAVNNVRL